MKRYITIDDCVRAWASNRGKGGVAGECGNVSFDGPLLMSYGLPLAVINQAGTKLFVSPHYYSNTTSHRKTTALWHAASENIEARPLPRSEPFLQQWQDLVFV